MRFVAFLDNYLVWRVKIPLNHKPCQNGVLFVNFPRLIKRKCSNSQLTGKLAIQSGLSTVEPVFNDHRVLRPPVIHGQNLWHQYSIMHWNQHACILRSPMSYDQHHWNQRVVVKHRFHCETHSEVVYPLKTLFPMQVVARNSGWSLLMILRDPWSHSFQLDLKLRWLCATSCWLRLQQWPPLKQ